MPVAMLMMRPQPAFSQIWHHSEDEAHGREDVRFKEHAPRRRCGLEPATRFVSTCVVDQNIDPAKNRLGVRIDRRSPVVRRQIPGYRHCPAALRNNQVNSIDADEIPAMHQYACSLACQHLRDCNTHPAEAPVTSARLPTSCRFM